MSGELRAKVDLAMAPEETFPGSVRGMLEYINVHAGTRTFRIYPDVGPSKMTCHFPDDLTDKAVDAIRHFVEVRGVLTHKRAARYPHEIEVEEIEVFPDEDKLPTLPELIGIAPCATGELLSEEFIGSIRDARE